MKPIFNLDFWQKRIRQARELRHSVYVTSASDWAKIRHEHTKIIKQHVTGRVLDAGCGFGRFASLFEDYVGVDFSEDFIQIAEKEFPDKQFEIADLRDLSLFETKEFDWAICVSIKRMVIDNKGEKEWQKMEKELKRVAQNLLILEYEDPTVYELL